MTDSSIHALAEELRTTLTGYIEATYHISDADLLKQRSEALRAVGVVHQIPFLESTPRYSPGPKFGAIEGLHPAALHALSLLAQPNAQGKSVLFDPPYKHQSEAIEHAAVFKKNLVIMTGTGSGKTESFLMPVLAKLAEEAKDHPHGFAQSAVRAMVLYPMNALVNDQLSRLRYMFGDPRIVELFKSWAGRPLRFARYTSRTPYAGIRTVEGDQRSLKGFRDFYVKFSEQAANGDAEAIGLLKELRSRGKWPAKPDITAWYGKAMVKWQDKAGNFKRAITLPDDAEQLTRHEVQVAPPDILVTNYSMLEYMLMRPVERGIFDETSKWLSQSSSNRFTLILDEAHLYRGAAGTEVALLVRRLRDRLGITNDQFQVVCSTASFSNPSSAKTFTAELTGTSPVDLHVVRGKYAYRQNVREGSADEAAMLASIDLEAFHNGDESARLAAVAPLLNFRAVHGDEPVSALLYRALVDFEPLGHMINLTMGKAQPTAKIPELTFSADAKEAGAATLVMSTLASYAKPEEDAANLLPARVHSFFRGLRGLWICMDPTCSGTSGAVAGKLYTQPRERCEACNAIVLELHTCRYCGTAYARGYSPNPASPDMIWPEAGARMEFEHENADPLEPVDLLLSSPLQDGPGSACFDLLTGEIDHFAPTDRTREVFLAPILPPKTGGDEDDDGGAAADKVVPGRFRRCGACGEHSRHSVSPVQDHETKGDQPLQNLVTRQLQLQPPSKEATPLAPLRGRKVLVFSDSRQVAARLAPVLQSFSAKDAVRASVAAGWQQLAKHAARPTLQHLFAATLVGAHMLRVRLRPAREENKSFEVFDTVGKYVTQGDHNTANGMSVIIGDVGEAEAPEALLADIIEAIHHGLTGLEALAIASLGPRADRTAELAKLPDLPGASTPIQKRELCVAWLREWRNYGFYLPGMPASWTLPKVVSDIKVRPRGVAFEAFVKSLPEAARKKFKSDWLPWLTGQLCEKMGKQFRLKGTQLQLDLGGKWMRCEICKVPQRPCGAIPTCLKCKQATLVAFDPASDDYFQRRKGFYRLPVIAALEGSEDAPIALIAAEHTAQLNATRPEDIFSKGERNELLFQDVAVPSDDDSGLPLPAVDVLSSTTTMEVGIDIGQLSGVALRNMPPSRANYQQRAGRAGRRANALASVVAFSGSDTHDEHFFARPAEMISGPVVDPRLSLDNPEIAQRHLHAFLLQAYLQSKELVPNAQLFSVLGTVGDFLSNSSPVNIHDLEAFLKANAAQLRKRAEQIAPTHIEATRRQVMLDSMIGALLIKLEAVLVEADEATPASEWVPDFGPNADLPEEPKEEKPGHATSNAKLLLDRLLYKGVLPRYAFPTDVATFHVFDPQESDAYRPVLKYSPSQGMAVALSQYAPGKELWIDHKMYRSGAIYSPMRSDRTKAWQDKMLYAECRRCGHSDRWAIGGDVETRMQLDCPACKSERTLGPVRYWFRPPGFAHRLDVEPGVRPDAIIPPSYATRANLTLRSAEAEGWEPVNDRVRVFPVRSQLLVSNTGPKHEGFEYCVGCGLIESSHSPSAVMTANHVKPYPDPDDVRCPGFVSHHVVLGTDFYSDVALFSVLLHEQVRLPPGRSVTSVALRTLAEALARAATETVLEIEPGEILAEYRAAITEAGVNGEEAEIFLYDTLPGGAGYSREVARDAGALLVAARSRLQNCEGKCDSSCYRCLRTFRNRPDHPLIDRHVGSALLTYLITGTVPAFDTARMSAGQDLLIRDLKRSTDGLSFNAEDDDNFAIVAKSKKTQARIRVGHPLCVPDGHLVAPSGDGEELVVNELLIRRNLPQATRRVREYLGVS